MCFCEIYNFSCSEFYFLRCVTSSFFCSVSTEKFLEDFIKQNFIPSPLPINHDTLKLLKDDDRKIVLSITEDENEENSKKLVQLLKAAAYANRDLVFAYVGVKQFKDFTESFGVNKKSELPKMVVWDGNEEYFSVSI